jgi:RHS repeat-associated protein
MAKKIMRAGKILVLLSVLLAFLGAGVSVVTKPFVVLQPTADPNQADTGLRQVLLSQTYTELVEERTGNQRVWIVKSRYGVADTKAGTAYEYEKVGRIVEVADGLCYQDAQGVLQPAEPQWKKTDQGFVLDKAGYGLNAGLQSDSWLVYQLEGKTFQFKPSGIRAEQETTSELLASMVSVAGQIDPEDSSRLIYKDAFGAGIDLEYQALRGGYHQNVIFRQKPSFKPEVLSGKLTIQTEMAGDGINTSTSTVHCEVSSSDIDIANTSNLLSEADANQEEIAFIESITKDGKTKDKKIFHFAESNIYQNGRQQGRPDFIAQKQMKKNPDGKTYLVESLDVSSLQTASYPLVWDYQTVSGPLTGNNVWYANNTYYLSGSVTVADGGTLTIEPGTVIKSYNYANNLTSTGTGKIVAVGKPLLPIIFTSKDDDSFGEVISGSDGSPMAYDGGSLCLRSGSEAQFCRMMYWDHGISYLSSNAVLKNCVIYQCAYGIYSNAEDGFLYNCLITNCPSAGVNVYGANTGLALFNFTIDNCAIGVSSTNYISSSVVLYNSIVSNCSTCGLESDGNLEYYYSAYYNNTLDHDVVDYYEGNVVNLDYSPYELGEYYLNHDVYGGLSLCNSGSADVSAFYENPKDWAIHSPTVSHYLSGTLTEDTELVPQYDTCDTGTVALGYHHPRIDYVVDGLVVDGGNSRATLKIMPDPEDVEQNAPVIMLINNIEITAYDRLVCRGRVSADGVVEYARIVDQLWSSAYTNYTYGSEIICRNHSLYDIQLTKFEGLYEGLQIEGGQGNLRNNIFNLNDTALVHDNTSGQSCRNNLFINNDIAVQALNVSGAVYDTCTFANNNDMAIYFSGDITVRNCLFHRSFVNSNSYGIFAVTGSANQCNEDYNAFWGYQTSPETRKVASPTTFGTNDLPPLQTDPLTTEWTDFENRFYLGTSSALINEGYPASGGLPGYTTQASLAMDTDAADIGYHYPLDDDIDEEGLLDCEEYWLGTNRFNSDSDSDLIDDYTEAVIEGSDPLSKDSDRDGMPDKWEYEYGFDLIIDDADGDLDSDGFTNLQECLHQTNPNSNSSIPDYNIDIIVPTHALTIQKAIDGAIDGDTVIVLQGTYNEQIRFKGKKITVRSSDPDDWSVVRNTILEQSSIAFSGSEDSASKLQGITIKNNLQPQEDLDGLVAHWTLNAISGNTVADSTSNNRTGTFNVTTPTSVCSAGRVDNAIQLQNSEYIQIGSWTGITGGNSRSCSAWVKFSSTTGLDKTIASWGAESDGQKWMFRVGSTNRLEVGAWNGYIRGTTDLGDSRWHHVTAVLSADNNTTVSDVKLYVDGVMESVTCVNPDRLINTANTETVYIGALQNNSVMMNFFVGVLDDIRIYDRALSLEDIRHMAGKVSLMAHWRLDETSGTTSADSSGNGITGTWQSNPQPSAEGYYGGALEFDGIDDYVATSYAGVIGTQDRTVSAWIKAVPDNSLILRTIVGWGGTATGGAWNLAVNYVSGEGPSGTIRIAAGSSKVIGTTLVDDNRWHHVAAVFSNDGTPMVSDIQLYIDGKREVLSHQVEATLNTGTGYNVNIGAMKYQSNPSSFFFKGKIDEVRIYDRALSNAELARMYFGEGGAIRGNDTGAMLSNCIIQNNYSLTPGAGIFKFNGLISNCLLTGNTSAQQGGALYDCNGQIINCTVVGNAASAGGGLYDCDGMIKSSIIWNNTGGQVDSTCVAPTYSCIQNWASGGQGNIASDPKFVTGDTYYHLDPDFDPETPVYNPTPVPSPCIDAGDVTSGYSNEPHPNGNRINMGAYGNTLEAEINPFADDDGDSLTYLLESQLGTEDTESDSDGDGLPDNLEYNEGNNNPGLNPAEEDSDDDGILDGDEDTDGDGLTNSQEYRYQTNMYQSDINLDSNNDGITNVAAVNAGLDPQVNYTVGESWTQYQYPSDGGEPNEVVYTLVANGASQLRISRLSETRRVADNLGRVVMERRLADPENTTNNGLNNTLDAITFTIYSLSGDVVRTFSKGERLENGVWEGNEYAGNPYTDTTEPLLEVGDPNTGYEYDTLGRLIKQTRDPSETTIYAYDNFNKVTLVTLPNQAYTSTAYDELNRAYMTTDQAGNYTVNDLDSFGRTIRSVLWDWNGTTTNADDVAVRQQRWQYDNVGDLVCQAVMNIPGVASTVAIDRDGPNNDGLNADQVTDYEKIYDLAKTRYVYTYSGTNIITSISQTFDEEFTPPDQPVMYDYSGRGLPTYVVRGQSSGQPKAIEKRVYDGAGRVQKVTQEQCAEGASTASLTLVSEYIYDALGRLSSQISIDPTSTVANLTSTYTYDGIGRKVLTADPKQIQTQYVYDTLGRLAQKIEDAQTNGLARVTEYQYNRLGNLRYLVAHNSSSNQTTEYLYDITGRVTKIDYPDDTYIAYSYDDAGQVTLRRQGDSGSYVDTSYAYDNRGKLISKYKVGSSVREIYAYDARGLMVTAKKGDTGNYTNIACDLFQYNGLGTVTSASQSIRGAAAKIVSYGRNALGQAYQMTIPAATPVTLAYTYTSLGQVDTITRGTETLTDYDYFGSYIAQRDYSTPNITFTPGYDVFGRITTHRTVNSSNVGVDFVYAYDANGNITQQDYLHRTSQPYNGFGYDDLNRLIGSAYQAGTAGTEVFNYDLLGNRVSTSDTRSGGVNFSYASNNVNEYTDITPGSYDPVYNAAGSLSKDKDGYSYGYDYENKISYIYIDINSNGVYNSTVDVLKASFEYDALGRRIEKVVTGTTTTTTRYYYDDQRIAMQVETVGESQTERLFVYGNYIDEVLMMIVPGATSTTDYYYAQDHLYSPVSLFDSNGGLVERYEYDVYGKVRIFGPGSDGIYFTVDDEYRTVSVFGNPYVFTGREMDSVDSGSCKLYYYRARSYDPQAGRFLQRDKLRYVDGMNLYEYVRNNVLKWRDPLGLCGECAPPSPGFPNAYSPRIVGWGMTPGPNRDPGEVMEQMDRIEDFHLLVTLTEIMQDAASPAEIEKKILELIKTGALTIPEDMTIAGMLDFVMALKDQIGKRNGFHYLWAKVEYKTCVPCGIQAYVLNPFLTCTTYHWETKTKWHACPSKAKPIPGAIMDDFSISYTSEDAYDDAKSACEKSAIENPDNPPRFKKEDKKE